MNPRPLAVRVGGGFVILLAFLSLILAVAPAPFAIVLPYLQERSLAERLCLFAAFFAFASAAAWWVQTPKQWKSFSSSYLNGWKGKLGMLVALTFLTYLTAGASANIWGTLAKLSPGRSYSEPHEVMATTTYGPKYRSVELQLNGQDQKIRYLTLSRKLFEYPQFQAGEVVVLYGKQTVFGVYVSEVRRQ